MKKLALGIVVLALVGCVNRPGWPEKDGAKKLRRAGYDEATIQKVIEGRSLTEKVCAELEKFRNQDVGFLLARNPNLSKERMERLSRHENDFVRAGLARNPALPDDLVAVLRKDESHTVWVGLAANPSLDAATLLDFKRERQLDWSWFAMNPACPPEVEERIRESGDQKALYWLERTQDSLRGWPVEQPRG